MTQFTGLTAVTKECLLLDAGAFFKNYVLDTDTFAAAVAAGKLIGATSGGGSFSAVANMRPIEVDGAKSNTKGLMALDHWVVTMTLNLVEITPAALKVALGVADQTTQNSNYEKLIARNEILSTDYLTNVVWVGKVSGQALPMVIEIKNPLSMNGLTIQVEDKKESIIPITLTGNYDATDMSIVPFEIRCPSSTPVVVPATFSHTSGDVVLKVGGGLVTGVKNGVTNLALTTDYTYSDPTLTLKGTYLNGLTGTIPITIVTSNGNVTFTVTT